MEFKNRTFAFCRADNRVLIRHIKLLENHYIDGRTHPNETHWEFKDNKLLFKSAQGNVTTTFHTLINLDGKLICLGSFGEKEIWHILVETNVSEQINFQTHISKIEQLINKQSGQIIQKLDTVSLRTNRLEQINNNKIKVVFLVHNTTSWDSLYDVYHEMIKNDSFEVIVASIPRRFPGEYGFGHEEETHNFLTKAGVPHIRFTGSNNDNLNILKYINPNAVFRQAPWDHDIGPEWSIACLAFTNIFYVPYYGFNIIESITNNPNEADIHANLAFHKSCAQIFFESELMKTMMSKKSSRGGDNFVATGHPKLERLASARYRTSYWPINRNVNDAVKIIWAPHHSFTGDGWMSFGIFQNVYQDMLNWVKEDKTIEVVLKPHPALFTSIIGNRRIPKEDFESFLNEWKQQPNTAIVEEGDYGPLMVGSDIMLTDGVSFLAEYMLFWEKPLIFLENKKHAKFNVMGKMIEDAAYVVNDIPAVKGLVKDYLSGDGDKKQFVRQQVFKELMPFENGAAKRIVESVSKYFLK